MKFALLLLLAFIKPNSQAAPPAVVPEKPQTPWEVWAARTTERLKVIEAVGARIDARLRVLEASETTDSPPVSQDDIKSAVDELRTHIQEAQMKAVPGDAWWKPYTDSTVIVGIITVAAGLFRVAGRVKRTEGHVRTLIDANGASAGGETRLE